MQEALYIVWNAKNELDIPIIDEQHRAIVSTINSLFYFIHEKLTLVALKPTLHILSEYTKIHFTTEELLMEKAGYTEFESHVLLHRQLAERTKAIAQSPLERDSALEVLHFLKDWWLNHINWEDRKYAPCVQRYLRIE